MEPISPTADRVTERGVGKGELVPWVVVILVLFLPAARLGKLIVREALAGSGNVRVHPIEHDPAGDVFIEPLVEEISEDAATLRHAKRDRRVRETTDGQRVRVPGAISFFVAKKRDGVTYRGEAQPHHDRVSRCVDEFVNGAAVEPGRARDLDSGRAQQAPSQVHRRFARCLLRCPDRERRFAGVERRSRILQQPE